MESERLWITINMNEAQNMYVGETILKTMDFTPRLASGENLTGSPTATSSNALVCTAASASITGASKKVQARLTAVAVGKCRITFACATGASNTVMDFGEIVVSSA
jgi:hypothetical protein